MNRLYEEYIKTELLPTLFCPGCGNGIVQTAAIRAIDALKIKEEIACVSGIGCSAWIPCYLKLPVMHTLHGRALAFAQGLALASPGKKILVFMGDGDCLAIGGNHFLHAARRNIDLTAVLVNNYIYGMTGGQKSPATPLHAATKTSPLGSFEAPMDACELAKAAGASFIARWTTAHPMQLEKAIAAGINHKGFSIIEVLCQCPVQAGKSVYGEKDAAAIMRTYLSKTYQYKEGMEIPEGKVRIGALWHDKKAAEYLDKEKGAASWRALQKGQENG